MPLVSTFGNLSARAFGLNAGTKFTPLSLFAAGEQGVWYDPSDLTTMFEDSAGTTAVHTPGNGTADSPVGLLLDKSQSGVGTNGAYKYNLLTYTQVFTNGAWEKNNTTATDNNTTAPDGTTTACRVFENTANTGHYVAYATSVAATSYTLSFYLKYLGRQWVFVGVQSGAWFDLQNGVLGSKQSGVTSSIADAGSGWYRCSITFTTTAGSAYPLVAGASSDGSSAAYVGDNTKGFYVWGAQMAISTAPTAYQKITSSWVATMAGNHATQSTSTARPTLSARYNLLIATEQFNTWSQNNTSTTADTTTAPDGTLTADTVNSTGNNAYVYRTASFSLTSGVNYTFSCRVKAGTKNFCFLGLHGQPNVFFDLVNLTYNNSATPGSGFVSASITDIGSGWRQVSSTWTKDAGTTYNVYVGPADSLSSTVASSGASVYLWGADLRVSNDGVGLPAYQRVVDANTYDSTGFPYYLSFDGVNRFMSAGDVADIGTATGQSTFTGTKIVGNDGTPYAKSLSNSAAYRYGLTRSGGTLYSVYAWGSNPSDQITPSVSDTTIAPRVLTVLIDRTVASNKVRANGTQIASATGTSTSDNFNSTYRFLVGAYNDTSDGGQTLYLNGRIYGLIVRNANSTATEISNAETWMNGKTKAY